MVEADVQLQFASKLAPTGMVLRLFVEASLLAIRLTA